MTTASRIALELGGTTLADLSTVTGLTLDRELIELKEIGPNGEVVVRRLPGAWHPGEVSLTRRAGTDLTFQNWVQLGQVGPPGGTGTVVLFDDAGALVRRYVLIGPWVRQLAMSWHSDGTDGAVMETLVVSYDRIDIQ